MRKLTLHTLCVLLLFVAVSAAHAQQVFKTTPTSVIGYLEYVPENYHVSSDKMPIVIFLHGIGERGANSTDPATISTTIQNVAKLGPPAHVKNGTQFPFILISPQLKNNYGTWPSWYVMEVINHVKTYLRVDERRIYVTGLSLGGGGVWVAAQDHPEFFAAIAPVCGGYNSPSKACNLAYENLPVWAFHGDKDTVVPMSRSINMVNAINACTPKPNPLAIMTIYPGIGHDAWNKAYKTDHSVHNPNVYEWMLSFTNTVNKGNKIPLADAGSDKTVSLPNAAILAGSATDTDGTIASYTWSQLSGPNKATLTNLLTKTLTASNLQSGTYVFKLTVKDNSGNTDSDYVTVTTGTSNALPVANAGADKTITLPTNSVSITGSGTDSDGTIESYAWSKVSGGTATLSGTTTATLNVTNMLAGIYVFRLTVTDNDGGKKYDDMQVTVNESTGTSPGNALPVANAGADKTLTLPTNAINITGSATDADGTVTYYKWSKVSGPSCYYYGASRPTLQLSQMIAGTYVWRLTVRDNVGGEDADDVRIVVAETGTAPTPEDPGTGNAAPVANAGPDKTLILPSNAINITGSATDADGTVTYYKWSRISGPSCYYYGASKPTLQLSQMVAGTYVWRLTVKDNLGAVATDDVKVIVSETGTLPAPDPDPSTGTGTGNTAPVANAGPDKTLTLPSNAIDILGSGTDADGRVTYYKWSKVSGPSCYYYGASKPTLELSRMTPGTYVWRLTVKDELGASDTDEVRVVVKDATASATSFETEDSATRIADITPLSADEQAYALGDMTLEQLENSTVVIFNGSGERIYSGSWHEDSQRDVMNEKGLYIYNVIKEGRRTGAGKIYIRN